MSEPATKSGGKYYVFYYDVQRGVELAARLPEKGLKNRSGEHRLKLQIRAKILDNSKIPRIAHFDMFTKNRKTPTFELANPSELVETRVFIDDETGKERFEERVFESGTLRATALKEKREMGAVHERALLEGPKLGMHGSPERVSKIASRRHLRTIDATMNDVSNFRVGVRNAVIGRTIKALNVRADKKEKEIRKIKEETPKSKEQSARSKRKIKHSNQERVAHAGGDHIPKVYVRGEDSRIERLFFEDYQARFSKAKKHGRRPTAESEQDAERRMRDEVAMHPISEIRPRAPGGVGDEDDALWADIPKPRKPKSTAALDCEDPLYVLIRGSNGHAKRVEAPHIKLELSQEQMKEANISSRDRNDYQSALNGRYEVWILEKETPPDKPHFFVIQRSDKGAIKAAARFEFARKDNHEGTLCADLWPYNGNAVEAAPLTHPTHNMHTHHSPPPTKRAQEIADLFANDALAAWHEHYQNIPTTDNLAGQKPDKRISEATLKGPLLSETLKPQVKAVA